MDCAACFETLQRKSGFCIKNHNMTSISPHSPSLAVPQSKGKCGFLKILFQKSKHTMIKRLKSEKYIFQITVKLSCLDPELLFGSVKMPGGPEGLAGLQLGVVSVSRSWLLGDWGVCCVKSHLLKVLLKQRSCCVTV